MHQVLFQRVEGADDARIVGGQKADQRDAQAGGVQVLGTVALHKTVQLFIEAVFQNVRMDFVTGLYPFRQQGLMFFEIRIVAAPVLLVCGDGAVKSGPRHDFGMDKMPAFAAHLPDAVVGLAPDLLQVAKDAFSERSYVLRPHILVVDGRAGEGGDGLTVDVDLELFGGGVTD